VASARRGDEASLAAVEGAVGAVLGSVTTGRAAALDDLAALSARGDAVAAAALGEEDATAPPACTYVGAVVRDGSAVVTWVGDSRIYRLRGTSFAQMSRDHTLVQDLVDRGALAADEAETHPMSHVLSRAVGTEPVLRYETLVDKAQAGDRYLLCSDGLTKCVSDARMAEILSAGSIEAAAEHLLSRFAA
jgi:serine/threonine protein phosphatase PrpC